VAGIANDWLPPPSDKNPIQWLLLVLALVAGLPFFVVATSAPLLQKWYADTGAAGAKDPYFLYGASNLGSMLALVAYPTMIEPSLTLPEQARYWVIGYAALLTLTLLCGLSARFFSAARKAGPGLEWLHEAQRQTLGDSDPERVSPWRRFRWIALAFVPSSLMLGVTTYVTTDVAPVAMLWIIPLTLYLLSFILVFTRLPRAFDWVMVAMLGAAVLALVAPAALVSFHGEPLRDVPLTEILPLQLGPVLSGVLAVRHLLYFTCFVLGCLLLPRATHAVMVLALPVVIVLLLWPLPAGLSINLPFGYRLTILDRTWEKTALHFVALFVAAMVCHGELARSRPSTRNLTGFYLCMSIGGVLGGLFNAMIAPVVFDSIIEYPAMIAVACLLLPRLDMRPEQGMARWLDLLVPACLCAFGLVAGFFFLMRDEPLRESLARQVARWPVPASADIADWIRRRGQPEPTVLHRERSFFGVVRVRSEYGWQGEYHYLQHGFIKHGVQRVYFSPTGEALIYAPLAACTQPLEALVELALRQQARNERRTDEPIAYFQSTGPIGDLFAEARARNKKIRIGVLGMGTGTLAGYAEPGWELDYYEIDPAVKRIAYNTDYFTYLTEAEKRGVKIETILGDGRLQLQKHAPDGAYDLIFMDAFSSDSVPVHLLTKEAVEMYLKKLAPGGIIIVNIANLYLNFKPVFGNLAEELHLASMLGESTDDYFFSSTADLYACDWVLLARDQKDFGSLNEFVGGWHGRARWLKLRRDPRIGVWTDSFSNLLSVFRWKDADEYAE
jgi:predicted O-methyltransferase YrrM